MFRCIFDRGKYITYLLPQLEYEHNSTHFYINGNEHNGLALYALPFFMLPVICGCRNAIFFHGWEAMFQHLIPYTPGDEGTIGIPVFFTGRSIPAGNWHPSSPAAERGMAKAGSRLYYFSINRIDFPRGYASAISAEMKTFSADYALPLAYPDWSSEPVIYLKRIRADLFYDWSYGKDILEGKDRMLYRNLSEHRCGTSGRFSCRKDHFPLYRPAYEWDICYNKNRIVY